MIVVTEQLSPPGPELLAQSGHHVHIDEQLWREPDRLHAMLGEAEALIVRNQTCVTPRLLDAAPGLKVIGRWGIGLENIDLHAAHERGIVVTAARNANATAVAEYVLSAIMHLLRPFVEADASIRAGQWERMRFGGQELAGRILGLIGVGRIGQRVARRAQAFGMHVIGHDPYLGPYDFVPTEQSIRLLSLEEVLRQADIVSLHVPLLPQTHHLINQQTLAFLRPHAILINASRGGVIDEKALLEALERKQLHRAVLDVRETEPPPLDDPLRHCTSILFTPHVAGLTVEAQERTARLLINDVLNVLAGKRAIGQVFPNEMLQFEDQ